MPTNSNGASLFSIIFYCWDQNQGKRKFVRRHKWNPKTRTISTPYFLLFYSFFLFSRFSNDIFFIFCQPLLFYSFFRYFFLFCLLPFFQRYFLYFLPTCLLDLNLIFKKKEKKDKVWPWRGDIFFQNIRHFFSFFFRVPETIFID